MCLSLLYDGDDGDRRGMKSTPKKAKLFIQKTERKKSRQQQQLNCSFPKNLGSHFLYFSFALAPIWFVIASDPIFIESFLQCGAACVFFRIRSIQRNEQSNTKNRKEIIYIIEIC